MLIPKVRLENRLGYNFIFDSNLIMGGPSSWTLFSQCMRSLIHRFSLVLEKLEEEICVVLPGLLTHFTFARLQDLHSKFRHDRGYELKIHLLGSQQTRKGRIGRPFSGLIASNIIRSHPNSDCVGPMKRFKETKWWGFRARLSYLELWLVYWRFVI